MPDMIVLPQDLTGTAVSNRIVDEEQTLDVSTGRCFALNYGGFYSASLIIRRADNTLLYPGVDYIVVAPYDDITRQTGKEAACAIVIKPVIFAGTYTITYQAIGGQYGTNIDALRQVLADFAEEASAVHWNSIIDKPVGFDAAPHLIDFRSEVVGFEGLIESIYSIEKAMSSSSAGEIGGVLSAINTQLNAVVASFTNSINQLATQISTLSGQIPNVSGLLAGTGATDAEVWDGTSASAFYRASNASIVNRKMHTGDLIPTASVATLNTTLSPVVAGEFNLRTSGGDASVPNESIHYVIETHWYGPSATPGDQNTRPSFQIARGVTNGSFLPVVLFRARSPIGMPGVSPLTLWKRIDPGQAGNAYTFNVANYTTGTGGNLHWDAPATGALATPSHIKTFITAHVTGAFGGTITSTDLDTTVIPTVTGIYNLALSGRGDATVPNINFRYIVQTITYGASLPGQAIQIARSGEITLVRTRTGPGSPGVFTRIDTKYLAPVARWNASDILTTADNSWYSLTRESVVTPGFLKDFIEFHNQRFCPIGLISIWPSGQLSPGSLPNVMGEHYTVCDGRMLSRTSFPTLFSLLNTRYGSTSSTNFAVPDLRGVVVRGIDTRTIIDGSRDPDRAGLFGTDHIGHYQQDAGQILTGTFRLPVFTQHGDVNFVSNPTGPFLISGASFSQRGIETSGFSTNQGTLTFNSGAQAGYRASGNETRMKNVGMQYVIRAR
jgi:hypothetical protein